MMNTYYVKADLPGLPAGRVERFAVAKAAGLLLSGEVELFDPKNGTHAKALQKQTDSDEKARLAEEENLRQEREDPVAWRARIASERKDREKREAKARKDEFERRQAAGLTLVHGV